MPSSRSPSWPALLALAATLAAAAFSPAMASKPDPVLVGRVTRVLDGDTLDVLLSSGSVRVRMHSIDAPEKNQPYGMQSKGALERLVLGREVTLQVAAQDRYERLVADVYVGEEFINAWQVADGHAWAYRDYLDDPRYCQWETQARDRAQGIWALPRAEAVPPWLWRKAERDRTAKPAASVPPCPAPKRKR